MKFLETNSGRSIYYSEVTKKDADKVIVKGTNWDATNKVEVPYELEAKFDSEAKEKCEQNIQVGMKILFMFAPSRKNPTEGTLEVLIQENEAVSVENAKNNAVIVTQAKVGAGFWNKNKTLFNFCLRDIKDAETSELIGNIEKKVIQGLYQDYTTESSTIFASSFKKNDAIKARFTAERAEKDFKERKLAIVAIKPSSYESDKQVRTSYNLAKYYIPQEKRA